MRKRPYSDTEEKQWNLKTSHAMKFMTKAGGEKGETILWHGSF